MILPVPDPKLVSSDAVRVIAGEGQAVAGGRVIVSAGDDDGAVVGICGGRAGVIDRDRISIDGGAGSEAGEHFAARPEGGVERAGSGIAGERELPVVIAGDDDLAVALECDSRAVRRSVAARAEAGGELAAGAERGIQYAVGGVAGQGKVVIAVSGDVDEERRAVRVVGIGLKDDRLGLIV